MRHRHRQEASSAQDRRLGAPDATRVEVEGAPISSLLLQVVRAHARLGTDLLQAVGVTPPHELVLLYLDEHGPVAQSALVTYLGRDRSTVTATLQAMERAHLLQRIPSDTDRRTMIVSITEHGQRRVPHIRAAWRELEKHTTSALSAAQVGGLENSLTRMRDALECAIEQPPQQDA